MKPRYHQWYEHHSLRTSGIKNVSPLLELRQASKVSKLIELYHSASDSSIGDVVKVSKVKCGSEDSVVLPLIKMMTFCHPEKKKLCGMASQSHTL